MPAAPAAGRRVRARLLQPLVHWWWPTTIPVDFAERTGHPVTAFVNGICAVDAATYRRCGGHAADATNIEDIELSRKVTRHGGCSWVLEGGELASCRMYADWAETYAGYTRSLWRVWQHPARSAAGIAGFGLVYLLPPVAAVFGSRIGLVGYLAAVARRAGERVWPDALGQPVSIVVWSWLTVQSWRLYRRGALSWKDRPAA